MGDNGVGDDWGRGEGVEDSGTGVGVEGRGVGVFVLGRVEGETCFLLQLLMLCTGLDVLMASWMARIFLEMATEPAKDFKIKCIALKISFLNISTIIY